MNSSPRGERGFSLIEVLVALSIFLIASMGLIPLLLTGLRTNRGNAQHSEARRLAGEALVALLVADYGSLPAFDGLASGNGTIRLLHSVDCDGPEGEEARLTVTATWQSGDRQYRYQLQTLRTRP